MIFLGSIRFKYCSITVEKCFSPFQCMPFGIIYAFCWHPVTSHNTCFNIVHCAAFLQVPFFKNTLRGDIAASCAGSKTPLFSHYRTKSFHPILDFRKLNIFLYRINYHLLTINAIIPSLLQHDLFYEIRSWVILSREISFLFLLGQWLFKHLVSAFGIGTVSLAYYM